MADVCKVDGCSAPWIGDCICSGIWNQKINALQRERDEAVALIDEVDTLAVNNVTGCGTCSTIQNLTTRFLAKLEAKP